MRREDRGDGSQGKAEFMNLVHKERSRTVQDISIQCIIILPPSIKNLYF